MPDYYLPTVIQPEIPLADMTASEFLLLTAIFAHETSADRAYFFAETGTNSLPQLAGPDVARALFDDNGIACYAGELLSKALSGMEDSSEPLELDMSVMSFEFIFQDIVRRSAKLDYVTAITSYVCSKMQPDGFGGWAVLITADHILGKSTDDINDFLDEVDPLHHFADRRAADDVPA